MLVKFPGEAVKAHLAIPAADLVSSQWWPEQQAPWPAGRKVVGKSSTEWGTVSTSRELRIGIRQDGPFPAPRSVALASLGDRWCVLMGSSSSCIEDPERKYLTYTTMH